jgi:hypothetical protein
MLSNFIICALRHISFVWSDQGLRGRQADDREMLQKRRSCIPTCKWKDNIRTHLKEIRCMGVDSIHLAEGRAQRSDESSGCIKVGGVLDGLRDWWFLEKDCAVRSMRMVVTLPFTEANENELTKCRMVMVSEPSAALWSRSSSKWYIRTQSVPQRKHSTSPLRRSTG